MRWERTVVRTAEGERDAIAPEILSASRVTDIPAFHTDWLFHRLEAGYVRWTNPFNGRMQLVSFERARFIVFWSKNPEPLLRRLASLDHRRLAYYVQFTLNDYEREGLEPGVPPLTERIETFRKLSERIGRERVIWRFDPLILANDLTVDEVLHRVRSVGDRVARHTERLVFSFADIDSYRKVQRNLAREGVAVRDMSADEIAQAAEGLAGLCAGWGIRPFTCGERVDLGRFGIDHGRCVDDELILRIADDDPDVRRRFGRPASPERQLLDRQVPVAKPVKDPGQREACGCAPSKDIGQYDTCPHLCVYCYANTSADAVRRARANARPDGETIAG